MASMFPHYHRALAVALLALGAGGPSWAAPRPDLETIDDGADVIVMQRGVPLRYDPAFTGLRVRPPLEHQRRQKDLSFAQATINVNFLPAGATLFGNTCVTWSAPAQAAFSFAAGIWASLIQSPVAITVDACWAALGAGVLGAAGPTTVHRDFPGAPQVATFYPVALANALSGADRNGASAEIGALFSSAFDSSWYYGTDGQTPLGKVDFVTVVLHELGHGLGFTGSMAYNAGTGEGSWGIGGGFPAIYDRFTENNAGTSLINTTSFPNPSVALGTQLTSNGVFFDAPNARANNGAARVALYAPPVWNDGSSYAHLAESFNGSANALMTFSLSGNESIHDPGPVMLGMFRDMGWVLNTLLAGDPVLTVAQAGSGSGTVSSGPAGISCGATCSAQFILDSTVTLTAAAAGGSSFIGWSGNAACAGTGTCVLTMSAAQGVTASFAVNTPDAVLAPTTLAFGSRLLGTGTPTLPVTLQNTGLAALSVSSLAIGGTNAADFGQSNNCGSSVAAGGSCTITVSFTPAATGARSATLTLASNDPLEPTIQVSLAGTGVVPVAGLSPTTLSFGNRTLGTGAAQLTSTLQNTGTAALSVSGFAIAGANAADFGQSNDCGASVAAGGSCTITVSFTPAAAGARAATLSFSTSDPVRPTLQVSLTGTGLLPTFALTVSKAGPGIGTVTSNPAGISCGATCVASFDSGAAVALSASPTAGSLFAGWGGACAGTGACSVTMSAARNVTATFVPAVPDAVLAPTTLTFGSRTIGTGASQLASTLQNTGTAALAVGSFAITGANAADFSQGNDCGASVAVGASCTITVSFAPAAAGARAATLTFATNDPLEPSLQVALGGTGVLPVYALAVTKAGGGAGVVTSTPAGIDCGATCAAGFDSGTPVALAAAPSAGSFFAGWSGDCSGTGACNVTMAAARNVTATFSPNAAIPRLANISTRMQVLTGADVLIGGFIIGGTQPKTVVVRARGPSLIPLGVPNALANPVLQLFSGATQIAANDNWKEAANQATLAASGYAPSDDFEAAIYTTLAPGAYTGIVTGFGGSSGVGIIEVFEVDKPEIPLVNIATRGQVLTGGDVMIGGFIIQGDAPQTVVIRARGPSLTAAGVPGALQNPVLQLFAGATQIAFNDDWGSAANAAAIQSAGFAPSDSRESAILVTLAPGAYTAIVTGAGGTTGVGIIEVFAQ